MGRRGGFAHNYDASVLRRLAADEQVMATIHEQVSNQILTAVADGIERIGGEIAEAHGLHPDVARLMVAQMTTEAVDFFRWIQAGEARSAGVPGRGLMDAMGYSSPTSITRMIPTLDYVASIRAQVDATGEPAAIHDDRGYDAVLYPRAAGAGESEAVVQARKRGWLPDAIAELAETQAI